jgi:phage regulator Rha-like protein
MEIDILQTKIYEIRGLRVMLDFDLSLLYEVETRVLNQSVKRNQDRFPSDFMFQLSKQEFDNLKSQIVISSSETTWGGIRKLPFAFSEQGVAMLSGLLKSKKAIETNIAIMRTFVEIRKMLSFQSEISQQMLSFKNEIEERLGEHDVQLLEVYTIMEQYLDRKSKQITIKGFKQ